MNIHSYQPEESISPFKLTTTVSTGHSANIFSTKFMPHSHDATLVTCAGDGEVRVFDIERAANTSSESSSRGQRFHNRYRSVNYYSQNNTNGRVYRSHGDRVKRIVTESSPHLFLTCSEDGEVRQFDLRLPSSAYPAPRSLRGHSDPSGAEGSVPPPLISYKKFRLDLNTISCSASQPHYIALGGAHLHCFLHDRRMLGRDRSDERGQAGSATPASELSSFEEDLLGQATRCVRKFAPNGRTQARRTHNPHITACKISDENPNEMIVSWSGDHVYSFDLLGRPVTSVNHGGGELLDHGKGKGRASNDSSQKRNKAGSSTSLQQTEQKRAKARLRRRGPSSLQVQYEDGRSEQVTLSDLAEGAPTTPARPQMWTDPQRSSCQIGKGMTRIRKLMFSLHYHAGSMTDLVSSSEAPARTSFERSFKLTNTLLSDMNDICRFWRYPVDPSQDEARLQRTLRANRDAARSFVQASGVLAQILEGRNLADGESGVSMFDQIRPPSNCGPQLLPDHTFSLDFIKAICLWLKGGRTALLEGFKAASGQSQSPRLPVPKEADEGDLDDHLIPYLVEHAQTRAISNVEASRFEKDETRRIFDSELAAVTAFSKAIRIPLEDSPNAVMSDDQGTSGNPNIPAAQNRRTATIFWGRKVARGLLLNAGEGLHYEVVTLAFGGTDDDSDDSEEDQEQDDINGDAMEDVIKSVRMGDHNDTGQSNSSHSSQQEEEETVLSMGLQEDFSEPPDNEPSDEDEENETEHDDDEDDDEEEEEEDEDPYSRLLRSSVARNKFRDAVEKDTPCSSHIHEYRGHCNVKTVKDANFFGLQDEYVVSGSDDGHLFIWDKKTGEVVNILEGDGQVVNVIQGTSLFPHLLCPCRNPIYKSYKQMLILTAGHPCEPLLAVSGIDNTIKIFSPDARAQEAARQGVYTANDDGEQGPLESRQRMQNSYSIMSQNDALRQGGNRDTFITVCFKTPVPRKGLLVLYLPDG